MRVLHVGYFRLRAKGAFMHSVSFKLSRGLVRAGHAVIDFSDRDAPRTGPMQFGTGGVNRALIDLARDFAPDLLLLGHAEKIRPATIAAIRREHRAMRVVQWNVDPMFEPDNVARLRRKLDVVDATLVSTAGAALAPLRRAGMRLGFLPNPVDFSIESGAVHLVPDPPFDLFYACGHPRRPRRRMFERDWNMDEFFDEFARRAPELRFCLPGVHAGGQGKVAGARYQTMLQQCAMGLNASRRDDFFLYSSDRLAQMVGNGLAALMDRASGYETLFRPDEMGFYSNFDDLARTARRLAADPGERMAIASAGRARYHALFNETRVARYVVDVAFDTLDRTAYEWPTLWE